MYVALESLALMFQHLLAGVRSTSAASGRACLDTSVETELHKSGVAGWIQHERDNLSALQIRYHETDDVFGLLSMTATRRKGSSKADIRTLLLTTAMTGSERKGPFRLHSFTYEQVEMVTSCLSHNALTKSSE